MKNSLMVSNSNKNCWPFSETPQEKKKKKKKYIFYLFKLTIH